MSIVVDFVENFEQQLELFVVDVPNNTYDKENKVETCTNYELQLGNLHYLTKSFVTKI